MSSIGFSIRVFHKAVERNGKYVQREETGLPGHGFLHVNSVMSEVKEWVDRPLFTGYTLPDKAWNPLSLRLKLKYGNL
jgi:hypothetical protein